MTFAEILLLATKSENLEASWPQGFFLESLTLQMGCCMIVRKVDISFKHICNLHCMVKSLTSLKFSVLFRKSI